MTSIQPIGNKVLVRPDPPEHISTGGIYMTEDMAKTGMATVVAAGPGVYNQQGVFIPNEVKAGDRVMLSHYSMNKITVDGEELTMVDPTNLLAIIEGE